MKYTVVLCLALICKAQDHLQGANQFVQEFFAANWTKCGESYFRAMHMSYWSQDPSRDRKDWAFFMEIHQFRRLRFRIEPHELSEADILNGLKYKAAIHLSASAMRTFPCVSPGCEDDSNTLTFEKWSRWTSDIDRYSSPMNVVKDRKGWSVKAANEKVQERLYSQPNVAFCLHPIISNALNSAAQKSNQ